MGNWRGPVREERPAIGRVKDSSAATQREVRQPAQLAGLAGLRVRDQRSDAVVKVQPLQLREARRQRMHHITKTRRVALRPQLQHCPPEGTIPGAVDRQG